MKKCCAILCLVLLMSAFVRCSKSDVVAGQALKQDTVRFLESMEDFPNPDRGFYQVAETSAANYEPLNENRLRSWRNLQPVSGGHYSVYSSLVFRDIILAGFTDIPLTPALLQSIHDDFGKARSAGVRLILRFSYTETAKAGDCPEGFICPPYGDAPKDIVLNHISQLKPLLQQNADVISCLQMGFVGTWGENYYSDYFGDASSNGNGQLFDQNWIDKADVLRALLDALPAERMIQVRTPQQKQRYLSGPLALAASGGMTPDQAYTKADISRIGFHNDCFVSSPDDYGTYDDYGNSSSPRASALTSLKQYFMNDSKYTAVGGETCDDSYSPFNDCEPAGKAQTEMRNLHYSFLNCAYNNDVNNDWQSGGCMDAIKKNLGYRLVLDQITYPEGAIPAGAAYSFECNLVNRGYAAPFNPFPAAIILRNEKTNAEYRYTLNDDVRTWYSGPVTVPVKIVTDPHMPAGVYHVFLSLAESHPTLAGRSEYAIRFANPDIWEEKTGYNDLRFDLTVI